MKPIDQNMSDVPLPDVPAADDLTTDWWDATREHRLSVQSCQACRAMQFPPRAVCISCSRTDALVLIDASGHGEVDSFTVVHRAPRKDLPTPYTIARVRLTEGPILLTRIETLVPGEGTAIGDRVEVVWWDLADGRALPVFRPIPDSAHHP